jgi:hypothetical protein
MKLTAGSVALMGALVLAGSAQAQAKAPAMSPEREAGARMWRMSHGEFVPIRCLVEVAALTGDGPSALEDPDRRDRFEQKAKHMAGLISEGVKVLNTVASASAAMNRYRDDLAANAVVTQEARAADRAKLQADLDETVAIVLEWHKQAPACKFLNASYGPGVDLVKAEIAKLPQG